MMSICLRVRKDRMSLVLGWGLTFVVSILGSCFVLFMVDLLLLGMASVRLRWLIMLHGCLLRVLLRFELSFFLSLLFLLFLSMSLSLFLGLVSGLSLLLGLLGSSLSLSFCLSLRSRLCLSSSLCL